MIAIAELPEYIREVEKHLSGIEGQDILSYLASTIRQQQRVLKRQWLKGYINTFLVIPKVSKNVSL